MDGLSDASLSSFLFAEGAFYVKGFLDPRINIQQSPHVFVMTPVYDRGQIPVKHGQRAKRATLQWKRGCCKCQCDHGEIISRGGKPPHRRPIEADDDIRRVGSIHVGGVVVLVVHKNVQRRLHFGDDRLRSHGAHQQKPVAFALLTVQRGGHNQLCGVLIHGKRCWALCRQEKSEPVKNWELPEAILFYFSWLILISTCLHTVGDGVIGANVEPAEAPELPQAPGEPVFCDVGVGGVLVGKTQLL